MANKIIELETSRIEISAETGLIVSVECFEKAPIKEPEAGTIIKEPGKETPGIMAATMTPEEKTAFDAA